MSPYYSQVGNPADYPQAGRYLAPHRPGVTFDAFVYAVHPAPEWAKKVVTPILDNGATLRTAFGDRHLDYGEVVVRDENGVVVAMDRGMFSALFVVTA